LRGHQGQIDTLVIDNLRTVFERDGS